MRNKLLNIEKHILIVILIIIVFFLGIPLFLSFFIMGYLNLPIKNKISECLKKVASSIIIFSYARYEGLDVGVVFQKDGIFIEEIYLK